jgi:hypothetical protein
MGSGMTREERATMRAKLNDAISSCHGAIKKLDDEDEQESGSKGVRSLGVALKAADGREEKSAGMVREVAQKCGRGDATEADLREGNAAGVFAARQFPQKGGPR